MKKIYLIVFLITLTTFTVYSQSNKFLDSTFGDNGRYGRFTSDLTDAIIMQDGKILANYSHYSANVNQVFRLKNNGVIDSSFGTNGYSTVFINNYTGYLMRNNLRYSIRFVQANQKLIGYGTIFFMNPNNLLSDIYFPLILSLNLDGSVDNTFGNGGTVILEDAISRSLDIRNGFNQAVIQTDNKILTRNLDKLIRFNTNGTLDTTFGNKGVVNIGSERYFLTIQKNNKILISVYDDNGNVSIQRYNTNGSSDSSYGTNGSLALNFGGKNTNPYFKISNDDKLVGRVFISNGQTREGNYMFRIDTLGKLDYSFVPSSSTGYLNLDEIVDLINSRGSTTPISCLFDFNIQDDYKILIAGRGEDPLPTKNLFRLNSNLTLDTTFGQRGLMDVFSQENECRGKIENIGLNSTLLITEVELICFNLNYTSVDTNTTGIENIYSSFRFNIYPNPANDKITIDHKNFRSLNNNKVKISNSIGQTVYSSEIIQDQTVIDVSSWKAKGLYFVNILDSSNTILESHKIILQ